MTQFDKRNLSMMMDFYEMTMSYGYFRQPRSDVRVAFDLFFRAVPDRGGYAIFAGLEHVIEFVENLSFSDEDIEYFRRQNLFSEEFLQFLRDFRFRGDVYSIPEGTVIYPDEPLMTIVAPVIDAQLVETAIITSRWSRRRRHASFARQKGVGYLISARGAHTTWMRRRTAHALHTSAVSI